MSTTYDRHTCLLSLLSNIINRKVINSHYLYTPLPPPTLCLSSPALLKSEIHGRAQLQLLKS